MRERDRESSRVEFHTSSILEIECANLTREREREREMREREITIIHSFIKQINDQFIQTISSCAIFQQR